MFKGNIRLGFSWELLSGDKGDSHQIFSVALGLRQWCQMWPPAVDMLVCTEVLQSSLSLCKPASVMVLMALTLLQGYKVTQAWPIRVPHLPQIHRFRDWHITQSIRVFPETSVGFIRKQSHFVSVIMSHGSNQWQNQDGQQSWEVENISVLMMLVNHHFCLKHFVPLEFPVSRSKTLSIPAGSGLSWVSVTCHKKN